MYDKLVKYIDEVSSFEDLYNVWQEYSTKLSVDTRNLKILILTTPCRNFGDVVFSMKLYRYLLSWYKCDVKIATPDVKDFLMLGFCSESLYKLRGKGEGRIQCRRFRHLSFYTCDDIPLDPPEVDLIFVAPIQADFKVDLRDVKGLLSYANRFNTFHFSEYNDDLRKGHDFPTGIGKERLGLLFNDRPKNMENKEELPYAVAYLNKDVDFGEKCFLSFVKMILLKYDYPQFKIMVQKWIAEYILDHPQKVISLAKKTYDKIIVLRRDKEPKVILDEEGDNTLIFDGSVFPTKYENMLPLYYYAIKDILVTGDQSITDVLSVCKETNVWYQIVPWKVDFSHELSKEIPNKYLKNIRTSCGTIHGINFKMKYTNLLKKWDFRKLGRKRLNQVINMVLDPDIEEYTNVVESSRSLSSIRRKMEV